MTYLREDIAEACQTWGPMLWVPSGVDGAKLLWAISGCESSFGADCAPRHEPAYDAGGLYATNPEQAELLKLYGSAGACSYGPWQLLLVNVQPAASPDDLASLHRCAMATVGYLNREILKRENPLTVEEIAEAYNSGKWKWQTVPAGVARYAADCRNYYDNEAMPQAAA